MNRRWLVLGSALLAVALLGAGVAYSETKTPSRAAAKEKISKLEDAFLARVAAQLGVSVAKLKDALHQAGAATLADALRQGLISKDQAAFLSGQLNAGEVDLGFDLGERARRFEQRFGKKPGRMALFRLRSDPTARRAVLAAVARTLGTTPDGLARSLAQSQDLAELARAKGVTDAQLGAAVAAALKPFVQALVTGGTLTQAEADALLARVTDGAFLEKFAHLEEFRSR